MYLVKYSATIVWAPDGADSQTVGNAQAFAISEGGAVNYVGPGPILVPGGNAPTQSNFNTSIAAIVAPLEAGIAANLGMLQGWATGGD